MDCWAAPMFGTECDFGPRGIPDPAHIGFRHQTLKRMGLSRDECWDQRIVFPVCRKHHSLIDGPHFHLYLHQLPASVLDFADEHDLRHILEEADRRAAALERPAQPPSETTRRG